MHFCLMTNGKEIRTKILHQLCFVTQKKWEEQNYEFNMTFFVVVVAVVNEKRDKKQSGANKISWK